MLVEKKCDDNLFFDKKKKSLPFFGFIDDGFSSSNTFDKRRFLIGVDVVVDDDNGLVIIGFSTLLVPLLVALTGII